MRGPTLLLALAASPTLVAAGCASDGHQVVGATDTTTPGDRGDTPDASAAPDLAACRGSVVPLLLAGALPYATARVGASSGAFLLDWATTASAIDPSGLAPVPAPVADTSDRWAGFDFFGSWGVVTLVPEDLSAFVGPPREAGIIGTDFLAQNVFVIDWTHRELARAEPGAGCSEATLFAAGLRPLSTHGYFAKDLDDLLPGLPNVPSVRARVGHAEAPAQLDTGYDDRVVSPAMNVNRAFFDAITAEVVLVRAAELDLVLSTCTGVPEPVTAWRLPAGASVELLGEDGVAVRREPGAILYMKETPAGAASCGGIGTWQTAAAQLGVSFIARAGLAVLDPETSRVWLLPSP